MLSSLPRNILRKTYPQRTLRIIFNQQFSSEPGSGPKGRGPVSWMGLGLAGIAAASAVSYFAVMRERRLEEAMGKVVSIGKPAIGGPWSLINLDGQIVTEKT